MPSEARNTGTAQRHAAPASVVPEGTRGGRSTQAILIIEDSPIVREPLFALLQAEGLEVLTANNGRDAIGMLDTASPALVLLDLGLPAMDGIEVLRHMRRGKAHKATPVIVITGFSDRERVLEAAKLGVTSYMLKSHFVLKDLMARIRSYIAPAERGPESQAAVSSSAGGSACPETSAGAKGSPLALPSSDGYALLQSIAPVISRPELLERLKQCEDLEGLSPTVLRVLQLTGGEDCSLDEIAKAVANDPAMATKVLQIANSPAYARGGPVQSVHSAVLRIGAANVRQIVLNIGVVDQFSSPAFGRRLSIEQFWEHSIACGIIANELARSQGSQQTELAFTSGLLHDLGRILLARVMGDVYMKVIEMADRLCVPLELVEVRMLSLNHAAVMEKMLHAWKFPRALVDPIVLHHETLSEIRSRAPKRVVDVLRLELADRLAHAMLLGSSGNDMVYPIQEHCRILDVGAAEISAIEARAPFQTDETRVTLLSNTGVGAWPRRADQVRALFKRPFRPLFVGSTPASDPVRIFCDTLVATPTHEPPNVVIVHVERPKERDALADACVAAERAAAVEQLPAVVITDGDPSWVSGSLVQARWHQVLRAPFAVQEFVSAVNALAGH